MGAAMLAGGRRHKEQKYSAEATMLTLAAISLIPPAAYRVAMGAGAAAGLVPLSLAISVVLLAVYGLFLLYSLRTHAGLFRGSHAAGDGEEGARTSRGRSRARAACSPRPPSASPG